MTTTSTEQEPEANFRNPPDGNEGKEPEANEPEAEASDPTEPIGRRRRQRSSPEPTPQTAFGEEIIPVGEGEADFLVKLQVRYTNLAAHKEYTAAERDIKSALVRMGKYDGKAHTMRAGPYLIVIAPSDGESKEIAFIREPSTRTTISREG